MGIEEEYHTNVIRETGYLAIKRKANKLRTILKEEGFKRLFFRYPADEIYTKEGYIAEITSSLATPFIDNYLAITIKSEKKINKNNSLIQKINEQDNLYKEIRELEALNKTKKR